MREREREEVLTSSPQRGRRENERNYPHCILSVYLVCSIVSHGQTLSGWGGRCGHVRLS